MRPFPAMLCFAVLLAGTACNSPSEPEVQELTHPTGERISTLSLSGRPHGVAVASNGVFYVSRIDADSVTRGVLTGTDQSFTGELGVGEAPAHIALDAQAGAAYTTNQYGNSVSIIDLATNALIGTVPLPSGGFNLLVSPDGRRVWASTAGGTLHAIDVATRQVAATLPVGAAANGVAYDARSGTLYISSILEATVTAVDVAEERVKRRYTVGAMPQRLALSPDGSELYIASERHGLEILTLGTGAVATVGAVPPGAVGLALTPDGAHLYVTHPRLGQVHVVDRATRQLVRVHDGMGSPRNVAFDEMGTTAIVTDETNLVHFIR